MNRRSNTTANYYNERSIAIKRIKRGVSYKNNLELFILTLPCIVYFFIWHYLPMVGLVLAFKNYTYTGGIFGSKWVGFKNFEFLFSSQDAVRIVRNTVLYSMAFIIVGNLCSITIALLLFEIKKRAAIKTYQTIMILPTFLSWVVVAYISYALLSPTQGVANQLIESFGGERVSWYTETKYWPFILIFTQTWKSIGLSSVMYYAALVGIDTQLYEAAKIDGANRWKQTVYISIPSLMSIASILVILDLGKVFRGDFGLFYQVTRDVGVLYPVTDIIDTYVYRGLREGSYSISTAVGLFQSVAGLIMVLFSNWIVKKLDPEKGLF